ncbi:hypothetical protein TCAL_05493 [Tigriopus californicus]|uniref:Uncharacterized protein n=1 Tax=Tigriopus californicus TaxID=6832 RepID=A0A553NPN2_TIGCA|nr:hypothetical protein TCAL_05493 [Tigriopus californicus]|eukprot:TCALIF_05493-PA protein Name:"Protein of unknown function" AED:0.00 eAED:0.00 QI:94/1/1/1/0/0.5/2/112/101
MLFNMRAACILSPVILIICVNFSNGGSISKSEMGTNIKDQLTERSICIEDANCSLLEYCEYEECKMYGWIIAVIVIVVLIILLAIIVCCCRCFACCCFMMP